MLRQLGLLHFKLNKNSIAEKCLLKAVSVNRQDAITRVHLADYYIRNNQLDKAGKLYLQILSLSYKYHENAIDLAQKLLVRGSKQLSISVFSKVITLSKKHNAVRERVIDICLEHGEYEFPMQLLEESIRENPSNYDTVYKAGLIHKETGNWEKAMDYFIKVDSHVRGHIDAKFQLAKIYYMNRKIIKADEYLNQILRIDPQNEEALELRREI